MNRKQFLKTSIFGVISGFIAPNLLAVRAKESQLKEINLKEINDIWKSDGDLIIYTRLAKCSPLGYCYFLLDYGYPRLYQYYDWKRSGTRYRGDFKYELVNTIEKKIYYWKGLLEFYENHEISNEFNIIPLDWLTEIYLYYKFPSKKSLIWFGEAKGDGYFVYKINPILSKLIENYPNTNKGNIIIKDMSIYI